MNQKKFKELVWSFYKKEGRKLPWRKTANPYRIWVSEIMLQQTQVARVLPKYTIFLKKFKTIKDLASAPLSEVLLHWQGLGYNRRAKLLHTGAKYIVKEYKGVFPKENLLTMACDVSQAEHVQQLVTTTGEHFGAIHGLVNNAGQFPCTPSLEVSEEEWDLFLDEQEVPSGDS